MSNLSTTEEVFHARKVKKRRSLLSRIVRGVAFLVFLIIFIAVIGAGLLKSVALRPYVRLAVNHLTLIVNQPVAESASKREFNSATQSAPPNAQLTTVSTVEVKASKSSVSRTYTGIVTPSQLSELGFKRTGRITKLMVDQGQRVAKGEVLATLDIRSLESERDVIAAELRVSRAKLAELESGPRAETIAAAKAKLDENKSMADLWKLTYTRRGRLRAQDAESAQNLDDARLQLAASVSRYKAQLQVVKELEAGTRKEQLEGQRAFVDKLVSSLDGLRIRIEESELRSPFDAVVSKRLADEGMIVAPGSAVLRLVEEANPEAWIGVPMSVANEIATGKECDLLVAGEKVGAKLKTVLPELNPVTRTQTAVFVLEHTVPQFGQIARLNWKQPAGSEGYWLPTSSLTHGARGLWAVFVVGQESKGSALLLKRRDVELLQIESDRVLVRGTISPGDRVVSSGVQKLVPGQLVKLSNSKLSNSKLSNSKLSNSKPSN